MPQRVQTLRSTTKNQRPANGSRESGELYVNFPDKQLGFINSSKAPEDLIAVRFFSAATNYAPGDFVIEAGRGYKAKTVVVAGPFDPMDWETIPFDSEAEPPIDPGNTSQYWRGDKTWQTLNKAAVGLGNVDNTSDASKPVSTATQDALNLKANLNSPTLTGDPKAPTPNPGDNDTSIATTAFVAAAVNSFGIAQDTRDDAQDAAILARLTDAPSDGYIYGRRSAQWTKVMASGGALGDYVFENLTTVPPSNGCVRFNNVTQTSATLLYITYLDHGTVNRKLFITNTVKPGVTLYLQDPTDATRWQLFKVTDVLTDMSTYASVPVQWIGGGSNLATGVNLSVDVLGSAGAGVSVSDTPPAAPQPGQLWWESDSGALYIYYEDANSKQFVQINGSNAYPTGMQRVTAQARNRIVNPAFQISQENGNTPSGTNGYFLADQWIISSLHGGVHSAQSLPSNAPAARTAGRVSCTTADASVAAGDLLGIYHPIEGLNVADFYWGDAARAKPAVLRFTAWSANGGTFCVALRNAAIDASFVSEFTLVAGVWTDVVIPVPACTSGTVWPSTNVLSGSLLFSLMCGSNYQTTTPNAWVAGDKRSTASQTNIMGVVGNDFRVTSVGLYLDPDNTGLAPPWQMPDDAEELRACQRYWQTVSSYLSASNSVGYPSSMLPVVMRGVPAWTRISGSGTGGLIAGSASYFYQSVANSIAAIAGFSLNARM